MTYYTTIIIIIITATIYNVITPQNVFISCISTLRYMIYTVALAILAATRIYIISYSSINNIIGNMIFSNSINFICRMQMYIVTISSCITLQLLQLILITIT